MKSPKLFGAVLVVGLASMPVAADTIGFSDTGSKAALAFRDTCLKSRLSGPESAVAAILARPNVQEGASLPAYGGGKPLRTFVGDGLEYLIRYGKRNQFGCFVAFSGDDRLADSARQAIAGFEGLESKAIKPGKKVFFEWTIAGSKDEVRLTPKSDIGSILINLEVK